MCCLAGFPSTCFADESEAMFFAETGKPGRYPLSRGCDGDSRQNAEQPAENQRFSAGLEQQSVFQFFITGMSEDFVFSLSVN